LVVAGTKGRDATVVVIELDVNVVEDTSLNGWDQTIGGRALGRRAQVVLFARILGEQCLERGSQVRMVRSGLSTESSAKIEPRAMHYSRSLNIEVDSVDDTAAERTRNDDTLLHRSKHPPQLYSDLFGMGVARK
jgi:hypothetical protein